MEKEKKKRPNNLPGPGPGRPKGCKDKLPRQLKDRIIGIWDDLEKEGKGLKEEAQKEPQWFYANFVKPMLPKNVELTGEDGGPLSFSFTERAARIAAILESARDRRDRQTDSKGTVDTTSGAAARRTKK